MGRCPSIEPPAFVHRFIGTLQYPWPKGSTARLETRTTRTQRRQQHARENTSARKAGHPPPAAAPRASPGQKLPEPTGCGPPTREDPENHREPQTHHATRATNPTREPPQALRAQRPRAKPGYTAQVPSPKPPHPSFFGIAKRRTSSR